MRRLDNTVYKSDIADNTIPEDYRDLKIIKKGQGQKDLKQFLSAFESGTSNLDRMSKTSSSFYNTQKINKNAAGGLLGSQTSNQLQNLNGEEKLRGLNIDPEQLKSYIQYHNKFLDDNNKLVHLKNYSGLQNAINQYNQQHGRGLQTDGPKIGNFINQENGETDAAAGNAVGDGNHFYISMIPEGEGQQNLVSELKLPTNLVPMWRVGNNMYDIYYIPGYDNWMYNRVKKNPREVMKLSKYKQKFFENMLVEKPGSFIQQGSGPHLVESEIQLDDDLENRFSKTHTSGFPKTDSVNSQFFAEQRAKHQEANKNRPVNNRATTSSGFRAQPMMMKSGVVLPSMRPNSVQNFRTVDLGHTQSNQTGFYPSGRQNTGKTGWLKGPNDRKLKTGTEFWQTSYQAAIVDPWKNCKRKLLDPKGQDSKEGNGGGCGCGCPSSQDDCSMNMNPAVDKKMKEAKRNRRSFSQTAKGFRPRARKTQCKTQVTEYNFSFGKLGSKPRSIMPRSSNWKPFVNDPLK